MKRYGLAKEETEKQADEWSAALMESAREAGAQIPAGARPASCEAAVALFAGGCASF
jgi:hypothetical protein